MSLPILRSKRSSLFRVFNELGRRYIKQFFPLLILLILEGCAAALSVLSLIPLADYLLDSQLASPSKVTQLALQLLAQLGLEAGYWTFGLLFVFFTAIRSIAEVAIRYSILSLKYVVLGGLISDAVGAILRARWSFFSGTEQGRIMHTLTREIPNIGDTLGILASQIAQVVQLLAYLSVPFFLNPVMTGTTMALAVAFGAPFLVLHRVSYRLGRRNVLTGGNYSNSMHEVLGAARIIIGFGRQKEAAERIAKDYSTHKSAAVLSQSLSTATQKLYQPLVILSAIIAMGIALQGDARVSELAAVMWSLLATVPILTALLRDNISIANFLPSYEQLDILREVAMKHEETQGLRLFTSMERGIELRRIHFTYAGRHETLLNVNVTLPKGKRVAIVGESGSGKSTVADLLLGLQVPDQGEVLVDGISLCEFDQRSFRERIGYVPQDSQLFHTSIRENLLWSKPGATDTELRSALQRSGSADFVLQLPDGMDTIVGDRGTRLSGGQRQRIALARALLRDPELLILDEATSALDAESERLIQRAIDALSGEITLLVIAHRLSTISSADLVYVMHKGRVMEAGSFLELSMKTDGAFARMLAAQQTPGSDH